ncbi:MAG: hypothetical protein ACQSGP_08835 [Frankia sp.]
MNQAPSATAVCVHRDPAIDVDDLGAHKASISYVPPFVTEIVEQR